MPNSGTEQFLGGTGRTQIKRDAERAKGEGVVCLDISVLASKIRGRILGKIVPGHPG